MTAAESSLAPPALLGAARRSPRLAGVAAVAAAALAAATLARYGVTGNGLAWAFVQVTLVFIAWFDILERRILNAVTGPVSVAVIALRAALHHDVLLQTLVAGAVALVVFLFLVVFARGGLGMGDAKLAGMIGLLLGRAAAGALVLGVVAGGLVAAALLISRNTERKGTFAYGPCLALGAVVVILAGKPPPLL